MREAYGLCTTQRKHRPSSPGMGHRILMAPTGTRTGRVWLFRGWSAQRTQRTGEEEGRAFDQGQLNGDPVCVLTRRSGRKTMAPPSVGPQGMNRWDHPPVSSTEPQPQGPAPSRMTSADDAERRGRHFKSSESAKASRGPQEPYPRLNASLPPSGSTGYLQIRWYIDPSLCDPSLCSLSPAPSGQLL